MYGKRMFLPEQGSWDQVQYGQVLVLLYFTMLATLIGLYSLIRWQGVDHTPLVKQCDLLFSCSVW